MFYVNLDSPTDFWALVVAVVAAAVLGMLALTWLNRNAPPRQHRRYRERVLERLHRLDELEAERADVKAELTWLWEHAPDEQAHWIVESVERARLLPRHFAALARRFGFDVPDDPEEAVHEVRDAAGATAAQPMAPAPSAEFSPPSSTAWSLPVPEKRTNGHPS